MAHLTSSREVKADKRTAAERELDEQMLALAVGRTRPMMYGPRNPHIIKQILAACPPLPWSLS